DRGFVSDSPRLPPLIATSVRTRIATLLGFVREGRSNIYTRAQRIACSSQLSSSPTGAPKCRSSPGARRPCSRRASCARHLPLWGGLPAARRVTAASATGRPTMDTARLVLDPIDLGMECDHEASLLLRGNPGEAALEEASAVGLDVAHLEPADLPVVGIHDRGAVGALEVQIGLSVSREDAVATVAVDAFEWPEPERCSGDRPERQMDGARVPARG